MNYINILNPLISIKYLSLKFEARVLWVSIFVLIITLLTSYVFQVSDTVSKGYQIRNYQQKLKELSQENNLLEINFAQINSLGNIEEKIKELGFEKIDKIHYIHTLESQIAAGR